MPFQRQFLIYERMTRLETAVPMVPLTAPPLPLNSGFKSSLAQTCPCVIFLFSSCWHLFTNVNHRATCLKFWEPYSTTYYNIRLELRQQLYSCHFNEKQDFLISKKNEYSQGRALHMSNATKQGRRKACYKYSGLLAPNQCTVSFLLFMSKP